VDGSLTLDLLQYPIVVESIIRPGSGGQESSPFQVVLKGKVLGYKNGLAILFDHVKVIRRIDLPLEQDARARTVGTKYRPFDTTAKTNVFTAYLKNSVTRAHDPLRVIACFFAC
jgi:hypothetical protein